MNEVTIALFGAFRRYDPASTLSVVVGVGATIADVRAALAERLPESAATLLAASAFANDARVLSDDESVAGLGPIAVLPPVCGG